MKLSPAVQQLISEMLHYQRDIDLEALALLASQEAARECVRICDGNARASTLGAMKACCDAIAQHFGLEENGK